MKPSIGQGAPDFTAPVVGAGWDEGATLTLSELRGERVVLVFYPRDSTPGCTMQACALRDEWSDFGEETRIFGVSPDDVRSHAKFIAKKELPYPLISDREKAIANAYGVWVEKSLYGLKFMSTERSTFVIGADGKIESILEKVSPKKHAALLREALGIQKV